MTAPSLVPSVGRQQKYPHLVKDLFPSRADYQFSDDGTVVVSVKVMGLKKYLEKPRAAFWAHSVNKTLIWGDRQIKTREINQGEATLKITCRPNGRLGECVVMKIIPFTDGEKDVFSKLYKTTESTTIFLNFDQSLPPLVEILRSESVEETEVTLLHTDRADITLLHTNFAETTNSSMDTSNLREEVEAIARSETLKRELLLREREIEDQKFRDLQEKLEELRNLSDY